MKLEIELVVFYEFVPKTNLLSTSTSYDSYLG